ncbi:MAG: murein L,D-transpeptidase [Nitratireductor sp.]|nr:murein L,D-transpeptidase [Nitratireductor sp.]
MASGRNIALAGMIAMAPLLAACQGGGINSLLPKAEKPVPERLVKKMKSKGMTLSSPIMIRIFKQENELEVWKARDNGRYDLLETYEICKWSGKLGPKFKEGDRQAPEGFYTINPYQMNPNSDYHLSFNIGYPNSYDRSYGRTGTHLMVHGACSSAGCYSMTDERIEEIYSLARDAFAGGQKNFQVQAFPFRMTAENLAQHKDDPNFEFWKMLKEGSDHFEITRSPPKVDVCDRRYVFNRIPVNEKAVFKPSEACPESDVPDSLAMAYSNKVEKDEKIFAEVLKKQAIRDAWAGKKPEASPAGENGAQTAETPVADGNVSVVGETNAAADAAVAASGASDQPTQGAIPVPQPNPMVAQANLEDANEAKPKKKGLFGWLRRDTANQ